MYHRSAATRETLALRLLFAMSVSELFDPWRIIEAGAISEHDPLPPHVG
jgi:hypothetical protein